MLENIKYFKKFSVPLRKYEFMSIIKDVEEYFRKVLFSATSINCNLKQELIKIAEESPGKTKILYRCNLLVQEYNFDINPKWWLNNGETWLKTIREIIIKYRIIGKKWKFNSEDRKILKSYYFANQLLLQCLHQDCYVSPEVRHYIEETLLLPIAEIKPFSSNT